MDSRLSLGLLEIPRVVTDPPMKVRERGGQEKNKQTHDQREQTQTTPRRKINKTTDKQGRERGLKTHRRDDRKYTIPLCKNLLI